MNQITVHKGRTKILPVSLGNDVSADTFTSEIRAEKSRSSDRIATWDVSFASDGTDGELILKLDDSITSSITKSKGYMDIKRISGGEPFDVFDEPLEVLFRDSVTE
jgi:hypothetical protein